MKDKVMISRKAVGHLAETMRTAIEDATYPSEKLRGLHGPRFVNRARSLIVKHAAKHPDQVQIIDGETDLQYFEREVFPVYLEAWNALKIARNSMPAEPTPEQLAVFEQVGELARPKATAGDVILATACAHAEMMAGEPWADRLNDLNVALKRFTREGRVPENSYWVDDDAYWSAGNQSAEALP